MRTLTRGSKLVVASHNPGKAWEINQLIAPYGLEAISAGTLGLAEPEETEVSFAGNARLKARLAAEASGLPALADDSGLEVAALDGAPGIFSARWGGPGRDFALAMQRVHDVLAERGAWTPPPEARFISVLCLAWPDGEAHFFEGRVDGTLVWPPRGGNGFGYDPMFVAEGESRTFGEMQPAEKYAISHRTRAFDHFRRACLESTGVAPAPAEGIVDNHDPAALEAAARNLSTKAELVIFLGNLAAATAARPGAAAAAETDLIRRAQAWVDARDATGEPPWRTLALALLAAAGRD